MKVKIINKKIVIGLLFMLLIISFKIYNTYTCLNQSIIDMKDIDTSIYATRYSVRGAFSSPNNKHLVDVDIYKENSNSKVSYIRGKLFIVKDRVGYFWKTIYWEKVESSEVSNGLDGEDYWEMCDVEWIDNQHIQINERIIDIYKGYDYRDDNKYN